MANIDEIMMERDTLLRATKIVAFSAVLIVLFMATCAAEPWRAPPPPEKTEAEQCATLCGSTRVSKFTQSSKFEYGKPAIPMVCECAP